MGCVVCVVGGVCVCVCVCGGWGGGACGKSGHATALLAVGCKTSGPGEAGALHTHVDMFGD